jgi:hypothetical protein
MHNDLQGVFLSTSGNISIAMKKKFSDNKTGYEVLEFSGANRTMLEGWETPENNKGDILNHFTGFDNRKSLLSMN